MLALGWPLALVTLLNQIQLSADLLTVGATVGLAAAGQYYLAAGIATAALVLANARGQLALATMARFRDDPAAFALALGNASREIAWLGTALVLAVGLVAVPLLPLAMGAGYAPAAGLLLWLLPWLLLQHVTTLLQSALIAARGQRIVLRANLVMTLALAVGLPLAAWIGLLPAFAIARAVAEAARLVALIRLAPPGRMLRVVPLIRRPLLVALASWALLLLLAPR
jgi:O-antigen/teichoic acid export membrane protein